MTKGRLLLIEDDPPSRSMLARGLQRLGYAVDSACDAFEGQAQLEAAGFAAFEAILVDLRMPRMDGLQFTTWLENRDPTLGVILLSAQDEVAMNDHLAHPSLLHRMHKPVPFPQLDRAVEEVVAFTRIHRSGTPADLGRA